MANVEFITGVEYQEITDRGVRITVPTPEPTGRAGAEGDGVALETPRTETLVEVDTVVLCAGQESRNELAVELADDSRPVHVIGGADVAAELDAKRAIKQAVELAAALP